MFYGAACNSADEVALVAEVERLRGVIEAVRVAVSNHPDPCELRDDPDDDPLPVSCGWKIAYTDVVKALGGEAK